MERGNVRADINVSLRESPDAPFGTRTETKNVNSFTGIAKTMRYEICRQAADPGRRRRDPAGDPPLPCGHAATAGGRVKSDSDDYRYFPDPDLVVVHITKEYMEELRAQMPEFPRERASV